MKQVVNCKVNGVVDHGYYNGKRISAMCGAIRCSSKECSLEMGECENQVLKHDEDSDA